MNKLKERIAKWSAGRYGTDSLNNTIVISAFILVIFSLFIHAPVIAVIFDVVIFGIIFYSIFRVYSRNISRRKIENEKFRKITKPVRRILSIQKMMFKERKTSRFRTCPKCKVVIRTSKERGSRVLSCPRCNEKFGTRIFF